MRHLRVYLMSFFMFASSSFALEFNDVNIFLGPEYRQGILVQNAEKSAKTHTFGINTEFLAPFSRRDFYLGAGLSTAIGKANAEENGFSQSYNSFEISILASKRFHIIRNLSPYFGGEYHTGYFLSSNRYKTDRYGYLTKELEPVTGVINAFSLYSSINYHIARDFEISLKPAYRWQLQDGGLGGFSLDLNIKIR